MAYLKRAKNRHQPRGQTHEQTTHAATRQQGPVSPAQKTPVTPTEHARAVLADPLVAALIKPTV